MGEIPPVPDPGTSFDPRTPGGSLRRCSPLSSDDTPWKGPCREPHPTTHEGGGQVVSELSRTYSVSPADTESKGAHTLRRTVRESLSTQAGSLCGGVHAEPLPRTPPLPSRQGRRCTPHPLHVLSCSKRDFSRRKRSDEVRVAKVHRF